MICDQCGEDHPMEEMELSFRRPDEVARLSEEERAQQVHENDDLCILRGDRFFIRAVLPLPVEARDLPYHIGLWVEVERAAFERIFALWEDAAQATEPPFPARIANDVPSVPGTLGLSANLFLTGSTTRPRVTILAQEHPLLLEQTQGISIHRAHQYSSFFA